MTASTRVVKRCTHRNLGEFVETVETIRARLTVGVRRSKTVERLLFIGIGHENARRIDDDLIDRIEELLLLNVGHYKVRRVTTANEPVDLGRPRVRLRKNDERK